MNCYFTRFFNEKNLENRIYEVEHNGMTHFVETEFVIETIKNASPSEKAQIKNIIIQLDFRNGDFHHFLKHLATGYVKTNY